MHESIAVFLEEINGSVSFLYEVIDRENRIALQCASGNIFFSQRGGDLVKTFVPDRIDPGRCILLDVNSQGNPVFFICTCNRRIDNRVKKAPEGIQFFYQGNVAGKNFRVIRIFFGGGNNVQYLFLGECQVSGDRYFFDTNLISTLGAFLFLSYARR